MRIWAIAACKLMLALPVAANAQSAISAEIAEKGLGPVEARLAALPDPTDADRFALGGVRFLGAVEQALQLRWKVGLLPTLTGMPLFRLPLAENPDAVPFQPAMIAELFRGVDSRMTEVVPPLSAIPATSDFALEIALGDLWFDINADGKREPGETAIDVFGPILLGWRWEERDPAAPLPTIRFDVADAAWLSAYAHMLSGFSSALLAYDPTAAITEVRDARFAISIMRGPPQGELMLETYDEWIDVLAVVLQALDQPPDRESAAKARTEFLAMVADNREFWRRLDVEGDNDREWLPNDRQQSVMGVELPPGTGAVWLDVLSDAEALLNGKLLAPYVWLGDNAGVNVSRLFTDPRPIDVAAWIQGAGALPYLEKGRVVSPANWQRFTAMVSGDALFFAVMLN